MHLSSKPPFDHVAVMSEFPRRLSTKMILSYLERSLAAFFPSLSSPTTVSCCELPLGHPHLYPRWHLHTWAPDSFGGSPSGLKSHPLLTMLRQLPQVHLPSQAALPFLFSFSHPMMPLGAGNLISLLLKAPFGMNGTQVLPAPGPTLKILMVSILLFPGAQLQWMVSQKGTADLILFEVCVPRRAWGPSSTSLHIHQVQSHLSNEVLKQNQGFWNSVAFSLLAPQSPKTTNGLGRIRAR